VRRWLPLLLFAGVFAVVAWALYRPADRTVRSALVGKSLPAFTLPAAVPSKPGLASADLRPGRPYLLNIFASWCVPCIAEAPQLLRLQALGVPVQGVAVRDSAPALAAFLRRNGDPYGRVGLDTHGQVQLSLGSSGVPESFVVDGRGRIVLQHVGVIEAGDVPALAAAVRDAG
jgi:cytochrome c biogenesis protein CcmG, thiol:disulfide interchange protein DsbE